MWRSDHALSGPARATAGDIDALNRVFSDAFTERYRRDGLSGVRVPYLNPAVWQFAIADAADGAMLWRDSRGDVVAFNIVHRSGSEGWMGPLAVRTDRQGHGHGRRIVTAGIEWLTAQGASTIGLETMPRTVDNIGFYSQLGFLPNHLTVTLQRERPRLQGVRGIAVGELAADGRTAALAECVSLTSQVAAGVDFSREIALTLELGLGDATMLRAPGGGLRAFALWHSAPLAQGRTRDELRVLKLVAPDTPTAIELIGALERDAAALGLGRVALRCQTRHADLYAALISDGYRVQWTDLRMTLGGKPEVERRGVMLSNWEI
ncbi:MAG TPA: GNAT family N-acetyltransferase [Gemmatimonadales bacterium]|jgi:GNAT superfamily N-acetyltransferase